MTCYCFVGSGHTPFGAVLGRPHVLQFPVSASEPIPALRIPVIAGPTAGGKSALAYTLVRALRDSAHPGRPPIECEIISADAFQIYQGLDIATAKATRAEQAFVRHHLIDLIDLKRSRSAPEECSAFTVADWLTKADAAITDIRSRERLPIVVGGTHLYIKALLEGLFEGPAPDPALRAALQARPLASLRAELERVDPAAAARIHPNDSRRTIRALEVFHQTGTAISTLQKQWDAGRTRHDCLLIGLDWPVEALNRRINARVKEMMDLGMLEETRALAAQGAFGPEFVNLPLTSGEGAGVRGLEHHGGSQMPPRHHPPGLADMATLSPEWRGSANTDAASSLPAQRQAAEALGTKQLLEHLRGEYTLDQAIERIKIETRRFAKNQRTWLKRLRTTPGSVWLRATETLSGAEQATAWASELIDHLLLEGRESGKF